MLNPLHLRNVIVKTWIRHNWGVLWLGLVELEADMLGDSNSNDIPLIVFTRSITFWMFRCTWWWRANPRFFSSWNLNILKKKLSECTDFYYYICNVEHFFVVSVIETSLKKVKFHLLKPHKSASLHFTERNLTGSLFDSSENNRHLHTTFRWQIFLTLLPT